MIAPRKEEGIAQFQKRMASKLRAAGYSLRGCQLVHTDFQLLSDMLEQGDAQDKIELYLERCRRTYVERCSGPYSHSLFLDGEVLVKSWHHMGICIARDGWRRLGHLPPRPCAINSCCMM